MWGWEKDWNDGVRRWRAHMSEMDVAMAEWRSGVLGKLEELEAREVADREAEKRAAEGQASGQDDATPADAPPAYPRVRARIKRGELDWLDVAVGDSEDPDVRAVHVWLSARLDGVRQAFGSVTRDMTAEEASAAVEQAMDTTDGAGRRQDTDEE